MHFLTVFYLKSSQAADLTFYSNWIKKHNLGNTKFYSYFFKIYLHKLSYLHVTANLVIWSDFKTRRRCIILNAYCLFQTLNYYNKLKKFRIA